MKKSDQLFDFITKSKERDFDTLGAELDRRFGETSAMMVVDSSGFTRTVKLRGPAFFLSILCRMRQACFETAKKFNAIDARTWADNFFAEFPTVDAAVGAALTLHRHFEENPIPLLNAADHFGLSIGIGYGRALRSDREGVFGDEMNCASKLGEDIAERGETLLTEDAFKALSKPESLKVARSVQTISGVQMLIYSLKPRQ